MNTLQVLTEGRARIETGWCQRALVEYKNGVPHYCVIGAIQSGYGDGYRCAFARLEAAKPTTQMLHIYNNASTTTKADILALFDRAIAAERAATAQPPDWNAIANQPLREVTLVDTDLRRVSTV